jgi:hypothetical protein
MVYEMGVELIFLNEPLINSSIFDSTKANLLKISIETCNEAVVREILIINTNERLKRKLDSGGKSEEQHNNVLLLTFYAYSVIF